MMIQIQQFLLHVDIPLFENANAINHSLHPVFG